MGEQGRALMGMRHVVVNALDRLDQSLIFIMLFFSQGSTSHVPFDTRQATGLTVTLD